MKTYTDGALGVMSRRGHTVFARGFTLIELLTVLAVIAVLVGLFLPSINGAREAARRIQCSNNLMQISLALHEYVAETNVLPPGVVNDSGPIVSRPEGLHWSWIVQILPFLDQPEISRKLNVPSGAYSAANRTLRTTSLGVLTCPDDQSGRHDVSTGLALTSYAGCHHDRESPIDATDHGVLFLNSKIRFDDVTDGLSQTIFLGEVARAHTLGWFSGTRATLRNTGHRINHLDLSRIGTVTLPATAAEEATADAVEEQIDAGLIPAGQLFVGGFGSQHSRDGATFAFGDGAVRFVKASVDPDVYRRLGHRSDGELLDVEAY